MQPNMNCSINSVALLVVDAPSAADMTIIQACMEFEGKTCDETTPVPFSGTDGEETNIRRLSFYESQYR